MDHNKNTIYHIIESICHHYKMLGIKNTLPFHSYHPYHRILEESKTIKKNNTLATQNTIDDAKNMNKIPGIINEKKNHSINNENTFDINAIYKLQEEITKKIIDITSIEELHEYIKDLSHHKNLPKDYSRNPVLYRGNIKAPIMIIGEAPGAEEDKQSKPFVGASGKLLDKMLNYINLDTQRDVYITNIVYWRPHNNRTPITQEINTFKHLIFHAISILQPKIIMIMGAVSLRAVFEKHSIGKVRGTWLQFHNVSVMPLYHPAALLYNSNLKKPTSQDLKKIQSFIVENNISIPSWKTL